MPNTTKPLKIYNASAGSGKTYHLVKEYITLLVDEFNLKSFSSVIAMTFTNKAALEMKERIIKALDEISNPELFHHSARQLSEDLAQDIGITSEEVQKRCQFVLKNILHQYEDFHVMTIDKFNLRLIRSFSRDLDLSSDFEVVMDEQEVIEKIVDDLLSQLGENNSNNLNKLLLNYAASKVDEGESWNIKQKLVKFGGILRFEQNASKVKKLLGLDFSIERRTTVYLQKKKLDDAFIKMQSRLQAYINNSTVDPKNYPDGSRTYNSILKILKQNSFPLQNDVINQTLLKNLDVELKKGKEFPEEIKVSIREIIKYRDENVQEYALISLYLQNFFNMALLQYMARALDIIKKEEQIILISEFNALISNLIQKEHAPFIYERLGTKFNHFLLDEFQDTSHLQWLNLVPLVHETLGTMQTNLIVGDPKQSIYRFKNGVAEQFVELPKIYNPENDPIIQQKSDYFNNMGATFSLDNNWRSSPSIVHFNNAFFNQLKTRLDADSSDFYNSIDQVPQSKCNGKIHISSKLTKEKITDDELVEQIVCWIDDCTAAGFNHGDISILGVKNKECNNWAIGLTERGYKVVSSDSLLINSNLKVQLTIAYLNWRYKPSNESFKRQFAELYFRFKNENYDSYKSYIEDRISTNDKKYKAFNEVRFIHEQFGDYTSFFFKYESLYDLVQGFYQIAKFQELENPYLHHLADHVYDFELKKGPHLAGYLEEYNRTKEKIAVQIPESSDAIQIMTIHKSKGLEFPVVLMPTLNYELSVKASFLVEVDDFIIYKSPNKTEVLEPLKEIYNKEQEQVFTDMVNLTYVAMTRPVERLYIQNHFKSSRFGSFFHDSLAEVDGVKVNGEELIYSKDDGERTPPKEKTSQVLPFHPINISETLWFPDISLQDRDDLTQSTYLSPEMQFGNQFHLLVSKIESVSEIDVVISKLIQSGEIDVTSKQALKEKVEALFQSKEYNDLFKDKIEVINEQTILVDNDTTLIPDKIIVKNNETFILDYKTGIPRKKDEKQVALYKQVLEEMGYPNVTCYLFYTSLNELRPVA